MLAATTQIHGWRWHNLSLKSSMSRLSLMCSSYPEYAVSDITKSGKYCCEFNHDTLYLTETGIFKPWLIHKTRESREEIKETIEEVWRRKGIIKERNEICKTLIEELNEEGDVEKVLGELKINAEIISGLIEDNMKEQDSIIIPEINLQSSSRDQKKLNNKILKSLGITNARTHLNSMWDVVQHYPEEVKIWKVKIPKVARVVVGGRGWEERIGRMREIKPF